MKEMIYIFLSPRMQTSLEISGRMVGEVNKIKDRHPNNGEEMVVMTMFSTL